MLEVEHAQLNTDAQARLAELRSQLGLAGPGATPAPAPGPAQAPASSPPSPAAPTPSLDKPTSDTGSA
jgi:hypothetical protein